ncbi:Tetraspanin family-domain-containing protein [Fennellomyces sp. T-0311]|nr:Tetraspanin family-domain-containing protein [Fennellomyces sp. T-0311]
MACCQRLSKCYLVVTNVLFACFGAALIAFGMLSTQHKLQTSILFPINILKMINILGLIICFTAVIGLVGAFCQDRQAIHILYTTIVLIALVYQISVAVVVYDQAAHTSTWLSQTWAEASPDYRSFAEKKFSCCGFSHAYDHPVATATCQPDNIVNSAPPCYHPMTRFMQHNLQIMYIVLFAAISIEILALCNAITLLCSRYVGTEEEPQSRRRWMSKPAEVEPAEVIPMDSVNNKQKMMIDSVISINPDERQYRQY